MAENPTPTDPPVDPAGEEPAAAAEDPAAAPSDTAGEDPAAPAEGPSVDAEIAAIAEDPLAATVGVTEDPATDDDAGSSPSATTAMAAEDAGAAAAAAAAADDPPADPAVTKARSRTATTAGERWRARLAQPVHPPTRFEKMLYGVVHFALVRALSRLWFRLEVVDRDWVPTNGPFVVAPVHRSNLDFFLAAAITNKRMRYIGKDSLWKWGPLGRFIGALGAFPVRRGAADREALRTCMQVIENGEPLVIFPEGTRQFGPKIQEVFDGPAYIATRTGVPIVPVGIGGSEKAMPKGAKWIKPRKIVVVVGEPLEPPQGDGTGRAPRRVVRQLTEQLKTDLQSIFDEARQRAE